MIRYDMKKGKYFDFFGAKTLIKQLIFIKMVKKRKILLAGEVYECFSLYYGLSALEVGQNFLWKYENLRQLI